VLVEVSGTAMAVAEEHLPPETAEARATHGQSEVERVLEFDELPTRVALGTTGRVAPAPFEGEPAAEPGWWVVLNGGDVGGAAALRQLSQLFQDGDVRVVERGGFYYLRADELESRADAADVRTLAVELLRRANGVARLASAGFAPVEVDHVELVTDVGARQHFLELSDTAVQMSATLEATVIRSDGSVEEVSTDTDRVPAAAYLALAADQDVARALRLIGQCEVSWTSLYHVYEIVLADVGGRIYDEGWATRTEIERFRRTANSPAALGEHARHGRETTEPPTDPMALEAARVLVEGLVRQWLDDKRALGP